MADDPTTDFAPRCTCAESNATGATSSEYRCGACIPTAPIMSNAECPPIKFWDAYEAVRTHHPTLTLWRGQAREGCECGADLGGRGFVLHLLDQMYAERAEPRKPPVSPGESKR